MTAKSPNLIASTALCRPFADFGKRAKKIVIASHLGRPDGKVRRQVQPRAGARPPAKSRLRRAGRAGARLHRSRGRDAWSATRNIEIVLLENLRFHKEEEKNDRSFSRALAALGRCLCRRCLRRGASRSCVDRRHGRAFFKLKAAGLLLQKELDYLSPALGQPGKTVRDDLGRRQSFRQNRRDQKSAAQSQHPAHRRRHGLHVSQGQRHRNRQIAGGA